MQLSEALQQLAVAHGEISRVDVSQVYATADGRWVIISPQGKVSTCRTPELDSSGITVDPSSLTRISSGPGKWVGGSGDAKD